jgi:hypothetical protein
VCSFRNIKKFYLHWDTVVPLTTVRIEKRAATAIVDFILSIWFVLTEDQGMVKVYIVQMCAQV